MSDFSRVMELALAADAAKVAEMMGAATTQQTSAEPPQHTIAQAEARQQAAADTKRK